MGYAKQLGKQYNAETAWNNLGTNRSAWEQESLPIHQNIFEYIKGRVPQGPQNIAQETAGIENYVRELSANAGRYMQGRNQGFNMNSIGNLFAEFQQFPEAVYNSGLAGRYMTIV